MMEPTPLRPDEQVAGGFIAMSLGGQTFEVKVLPMGANRRWTAHLAETMAKVLGEVGPMETADQVASMLAAQATTMMDLLISYDQAGASVLPDREWIDTHATDTECYQAMKRVTVAAYPFGPDLLRIAPQIMPVLMGSLSRGVAAASIAMASSRSTSSARRSTAGRPDTSKPTSPTSSSSSMSRKPPSARSKRRSQN